MKTKKSNTKGSKKVSKKVVQTIESHRSNRLAMMILSARANQRTRLVTKTQEKAIKKVIADTSARSEYLALHRDETQAALIDRMLQQSATLTDIVKAILLGDTKTIDDKRKITTRVKSHFKHLLVFHTVRVTKDAEKQIYRIPVITSVPGKG